jgi:hypothetical protein
MNVGSPVVRCPSGNSKWNTQRVRAKNIPAKTEGRYAAVLYDSGADPKRCGHAQRLTAYRHPKHIGSHFESNQLLILSI